MHLHLAPTHSQRPQPPHLEVKPVLTPHLHQFNLPALPQLRYRTHHRQRLLAGPQSRQNGVHVVDVTRTLDALKDGVQYAHRLRFSLLLVVGFPSTARLRRHHSALPRVGVLAAGDLVYPLVADLLEAVQQEGLGSGEGEVLIDGRSQGQWRLVLMPMRDRHTIGDTGCVLGVIMCLCLMHALAPYRVFEDHRASRTRTVPSVGRLRSSTALTASSSSSSHVSPPLRPLVLLPPAVVGVQFRVDTPVICLDGSDVLQEDVFGTVCEEGELSERLGLASAGLRHSLPLTGIGLHGSETHTQETKRDMHQCSHPHGTD